VVYSVERFFWTGNFGHNYFPTMTSSASPKNGNKSREMPTNTRKREREERTQFEIKLHTAQSALSVSRVTLSDLTKRSKTIV
jgi:hypothetical protein